MLFDHMIRCNRTSTTSQAIFALSLLPSICTFLTELLKSVPPLHLKQRIGIFGCSLLIKMVRPSVVIPHLAQREATLKERKSPVS